MTAKAYLEQAFRLDQRINSKIAQVSSLHELATKATSTISDMPRAASPNVHRMEDIIMKIFALEEEINADIDALVDLKREIVAVIKAVENTEYQTVLEKRYLNFDKWEQIAVDMGYSMDWLFAIHRAALKNIEIPERQQ
ncbi:MAG: DUF1492 domain-containing protein [Eubacteriales bacterium]|nr:DUF1492 domain-containing protein [Eubacteriales bacterium]